MGELVAAGHGAATSSREVGAEPGVETRAGRGARCTRCWLSLRRKVELVLARRGGAAVPDAGAACAAVAGRRSDGGRQREGRRRRCDGGGGELPSGLHRRRELVLEVRRVPLRSRERARVGTVRSDPAPPGSPGRTPHALVHPTFLAACVVVAVGAVAVGARAPRSCRPASPTAARWGSPSGARPAPPATEVGGPRPPLGTSGRRRSPPCAVGGGRHRPALHDLQQRAHRDGAGAGVQGVVGGHIAVHGAVPDDAVPLRRVERRRSPRRWGHPENNYGLYAFRNPTTPYKRAFWHPGLGIWQYDTRGPRRPAHHRRGDGRRARWPPRWRPVMSSRYCAASRLDTSASDQRRYGLGATGATRARSARSSSTRWLAPRPTFANLELVAGISALGGVVRHTCDLPGVAGTLPCWYVEPTVGVIQGATAWATLTPLDGGSSHRRAHAALRAVLRGRPRRHRGAALARDDTGYSIDIHASRTIGRDARPARPRRARASPGHRRRACATAPRSVARARLSRPRPSGR